MNNRNENKETGFTALSIKVQVVKKFRGFSKKIASTHSLALEEMLDFFDRNSVSPYENLGPKKNTLENLFKKRINGMIAIIKNIEENQTKPTLAMLQLLFEGQSTKKNELLVEKKQADRIWQKENVNEEDQMQSEILDPKKNYHQVQIKLIQTRKEFNHILNKVVVVRNNFGRPYLRLNLSIEEFEQLKRKFNSN